MSRLLSVGTQTKQTFVTLLWKCLEDLIEFPTFYLYYNDNFKFDGHPCFKIAFFYRSSLLIEHIFKYSSKFILTILLMKSDRDFLMNHNIFLVMDFIPFPQFYTDKNHGLLGTETQKHLFRLLTDFLTTGLRINWNFEQMWQNLQFMTFSHYLKC